MKRLALFLTIIAAVAAAPTRARAHGDFNMLMGSTSNGGGSLKLDYDFSSVSRLAFAGSLGGYSVYTGQEPSFTLLQTNDVVTPSYVIADGTDLNVVITGIDDGKVSIQIVNLDTLTTYNLNHVGDTALLGVVGPGNTLDPAAADPHIHPTFQVQLQLPEGQFGEGSVSFKLTTSGGYSESPIYTLKVSNGPLAHIDYDTAAYGAKSVVCQLTVGAQTRALVNAKFALLQGCLAYANIDTAMAAVTPALPKAAAAHAKAALACTDATGVGPDSKTILGKIAAVRTAAFNAIKARCGSATGSGDFTDDDINQQLGLAECRTEELVAAAYGGAKEILAGYTARASQGGGTFDTHFPCLYATASE
ncbi:MAG TPA: hypothetical protein VL403_15855 [Candidatus Kryptonia bacterium]|nr:hypothetical protein [Candidatus Kryptonia bacterium]